MNEARRRFKKLECNLVGRRLKILSAGKEEYDKEEFTKLMSRYRELLIDLIGNESD
jgi:hypothetical protein